jgi:hypothetical protein
MENDGILYSVSKKAEKTIENYSILFELYKKLSGNGTKKICTLGDISDTLAMRKEVYDYMSLEISKYVKAMALVSRTPTGKTVGRAFQLLNISDCAVAIFDNRKDALDWLRQYL